MQTYDTNWSETFHHTPFEFFKIQRVLGQGHRQSIRTAILFRFGGSCILPFDKSVGSLLVANIQSILLLPPPISYVLRLQGESAQPSSLSFSFFKLPTSNTSLKFTHCWCHSLLLISPPCENLTDWKQSMISNNIILALATSLRQYFSIDFIIMTLFVPENSDPFKFYFYQGLPFHSHLFYLIFQFSSMSIRSQFLYFHLLMNLLESSPLAPRPLYAGAWYRYK